MATARARADPSLILMATPRPSGRPTAYTDSAPALAIRPGMARCRATSSRVVPETHSGCARIAAATDSDEAERGRAAFDKVLRYPADRAAEEIIEAAVARRPRLLIGNDARALDAVARLLPARYWSLMGRGMALAAKRQ